LQCPVFIYFSRISSRICRCASSRQTLVFRFERRNDGWRSTENAAWWPWGDSHGGDRGARRIVSPTIKSAIEGLALETRPLPITSVHRQIKQFAETIGEPAPSYWTVYDVVRELPPSLLTLAHKGGKSYGESFDLVHRREANKPNSIWQADHAQLDILLVKEDGTVARPWLTIVIDDYSRAIAGYYLGFDPPSSVRTSLALRQGIWRKGHPHWHICGIPEILYTDRPWK